MFSNFLIVWLVKIFEYLEIKFVKIKEMTSLVKVEEMSYIEWSTTLIATSHPPTNLTPTPILFE